MRGEPFPVVGSPNYDLVAGVGQPVEGALTQNGILEQPQLFFHRPVAGDHEAGGPVSVEDQFVQLRRLLGGVKRCSPRSSRISRSEVRMERKLSSRELSTRAWVHDPEVVVGVNEAYCVSGPDGSVAQGLGQRRADPVGEGAGALQLGLEVDGGVGHPECLQLGGLALGILAQQHEVAGVSDQAETIAVPVAADLGAFGGKPGIVASGFYLHHAALGNCPCLGKPFDTCLAAKRPKSGCPAPCCPSLMTLNILGRSVSPTEFSRSHNAG